MRNNLINNCRELLKAVSLSPYGVDSSNFFYPPWIGPTYLSHGKGTYVYDLDGNKYIDCLLGFGSVLLGHNCEGIENTVVKKMKNGVHLGLTNALQNTLTKEILSLYPMCDMVQYFKTGSDACSAAIRIARIVSKKSVIFTSGYHGWHDDFMYSMNPNGIPHPPACYDFKYNLRELQKLFKTYSGDVAAVFLEPNARTNRVYLSIIKELCRKNDALFMLDEMKTGFRVSLGGVQELYCISADITTVGKALSNGFPLACVLGSEKCMLGFNSTSTSSTHATNIVDIQAALECIQTIKRDNVITKISEIGSEVIVRVNSMAKQYGITNFKLDDFTQMPRINIIEQNAGLNLNWLLAKEGLICNKERLYLCAALCLCDIDEIVRAFKNALLSFESLDKYPVERISTCDYVIEVIKSSYFRLLDDWILDKNNERFFNVSEQKIVAIETEFWYYCVGLHNDMYKQIKLGELAYHEQFKVSLYFSYLLCCGIIKCKNDIM